MKLACLLWGLLVLPAAYALDCRHAVTQSDMNQCAAQDFTVADKRLNRLYGEYRARLAEDDKARLTLAQRAWLTFRDVSCDFESAGVAGGSVYPMIYQQCLARKTATRSEDIRQLLLCREGDLSCPVLQ